MQDFVHKSVDKKFQQIKLDFPTKINSAHNFSIWSFSFWDNIKKKSNRTSKPATNVSDWWKVCSV